MKRGFTLLELVIGIAILSIAASAIGWRVHRATENYRFSTDVDRLKTTLIQCRSLALTIQTDWEATLSQVAGEWQLKSECFGNVKLRSLPIQHLGTLEISWNGEQKGNIFFLFSSTGETLVDQQRAGVLVLSRKKLQAKVQFPNVFHVE